MTARSPSELADRAGVPTAFVERLVDLGIVGTAGDEAFSDADVYKVRFVWSSDQGGLSLEAIARAISEGNFSLAFLEGTQYRWAALSSRTYAEVADETGYSVDLVLSFEEALGKVRPHPDDPAPDDLLSMLELTRVVLAERVHIILLEQLADERRDVHPGGGHRPSSSDLGLSMRMAVALYVRGISTAEVHIEFPPRLGTLTRPVILAEELRVPAVTIDRSDIVPACVVVGKPLIRQRLESSARAASGSYSDESSPWGL